jgi:hypothetical protein
MTFLKIHTVNQDYLFKVVNREDGMNIYGEQYIYDTNCYGYSIIEVEDISFIIDNLEMLLMSDEIPLVKYGKYYGLPTLDDEIVDILWVTRWDIKNGKVAVSELTLTIIS